MTLIDLVNYLESLLQPQAFRDYCPNGLQVEGPSRIQKIVTGVTANQALIEAAVKVKADAILVHHGFFWKNEHPCLVGMKYRRIKTLLEHNISLLAYHLPLDAHPLYGNNIQLGNLLGIEFMRTFEIEPGLPIGFIGQLKEKINGEQFSELLTEKLARKPLYIAGDEHPISTIAWCTGAAQDALTDAIRERADAYLTGEVSERTVDIARENGIHFYAAGHHATERYGVKALGDHLANQFNLEHVFIDIDNPV